MIRATFIMEQHLGHRSYYENLRQVIDESPHIDPTWVPVTYTQSGSMWERLPLLSPHVRGTLAGRMQVKQGLRQPTDIFLFNTQVPAVLGGTIDQPYLLATNITPIQYDQMAHYYGHRPDQDGILSRYKHQANLKTFQGAARVLPWSSWTADSLMHDYGVDPDCIEVIPPGVDTTIWRPREQSSFRKAMRILFVGADLKRKGGDSVLKAFRSLAKEMVELIVVTQDKLPLEQGVRVYNNMKPNSPELIALYQSCDVFVMPSKAEAFGIAAIEASAVGLPLITTAVGGLKDIVEEGKTGFFIQPDDHATLARRLHLLAKNPGLRRELGHAARQRAETQFNSYTNAGRIAHILQEVVAQKVC